MRKFTIRHETNNEVYTTSVLADKYAFDVENRCVKLINESVEIEVIPEKIEHKRYFPFFKKVKNVIPERHVSVDYERIIKIFWKVLSVSDDGEVTRDGKLEIEREHYREQDESEFSRAFNQE